MDMAVTRHTSFASAYRQLTPAERAFVDATVQWFEQDADRTGERISLALSRPVPAVISDRSRGMLDKPMVTAAITERVTELAAARELTAQRMIRECMAIAFSSMGDYMEVDADGTPVFDLARCTPEQLAAIKSIDVEEVGDPMSRSHKRKFKIQLHDKIAGIDRLGRFMGLWDADNPVWRADQEKVAAARMGPALTAAEAGQRYADMLGD